MNGDHRGDVMWYVALPKYAAKSELPTYVSFWRPPVVESFIFDPPSDSTMRTGRTDAFRKWASGLKCCIVTCMNMFTMLFRYTLLGIR
jgi:hypothetical protein